MRTFVPFRPVDSYAFRVLGPLYPCGPLNYCGIRNFLDPSRQVDPCAFQDYRGPFAPLRTFVSFRPLHLCVFRKLESLYACGPSWTVGPLCLVDPGVFGPLGLLYPSNPWTLRTLVPLCTSDYWTPALGAEADRSEPTLSNYKTRAPDVNDISFANTPLSSDCTLCWEYALIRNSYCITQHTWNHLVYHGTSDHKSSCVCLLN